jgi:hypothetical protein
MTDVGLDVVRFVYRLMQIDPEWSVWSDRGFTWWGHSLAQRVWAEPCVEDHGFTVARVHARTDLLDGLTWSDEQLQKLMSLSFVATLSGLVRDPADPARAQLACSVYIHAETVGWLREVMAWAVGIQAAEAHAIAEQAAALVGVQPAVSAHPQSGPRAVPDDMLNLLAATVVPAGEAASLYAGKDMAETLKRLDRPPCVLATGDDKGVTAEFPFGGLTSLLRLKTEEANPRLGNGLLVLLEVPAGESGAGNLEAARLALTLNERELASLTRCHFLGSWCPGDRVLAFVSFWPNAMHQPGLAWGLIPRAVVDRSFWVAKEVFGMDTDFEAAMKNKLDMMAALEEAAGLGRVKKRRRKPPGKR